MVRDGQRAGCPAACVSVIASGGSVKGSLLVRACVFRAFPWVTFVIARIHTYIQSSPYFDPTHTRTGWIGQPPILDRLEVVTDNGDVDTLGQATP